MGDILTKPKAFYDNFERKPGAYPKVTHYCPGCGHGRIHKLIAEALDDLEIADKTVLVSPVGCSVFAYYYFDCGNIQSAHGRAPAVGTGAARGNPGSITISYQGDGDLGAIGTSEIIHAANRGENMTVIFVNNQIYGMTGGQMAPTTLEGQKTVTCPQGRDITDVGQPLRMSEMIATMEAPVLVERVAVTDIKAIMKARKTIRKALQSQKDGKGLSFVEILSACPIGWKMKPVDAIKRLKEEVEPYFPVKNFKDEVETRTPKETKTREVDPQKVIETLEVNHDSNLFQKDDLFIQKFKEQRIRIAGFGGQGVLMAGTTLGYLGMELGLNTTWLPSYGPEMRGGTANCHVNISNREIGSPVVEDPNVLIAMNAPSLKEFSPTVSKDGLIIVNSSIIDQKVEREDVDAIYIPMTDIAESLDIKAASNMCAITAYLAYTKIIDVEKLISAIEFNFKKKNLIGKNIEVVKKTAEYIKENYA